MLWSLANFYKDLVASFLEIGRGREPVEPCAVEPLLSGKGFFTIDPHAEIVVSTTADLYGLINGRIEFSISVADRFFGRSD